jgi:hypothetical protein
MKEKKSHHKEKEMSCKASKMPKGMEHHKKEMKKESKHKK